MHCLVSTPHNKYPVYTTLYSTPCSRLFRFRILGEMNQLRFHGHSSHFILLDGFLCRSLRQFSGSRDQSTSNSSQLGGVIPRHLRWQGKHTNTDNACCRHNNRYPTHHWNARRGGEPGSELSLLGSMLSLVAIARGFAWERGGGGGVSQACDPRQCKESHENGDHSNTSSHIPICTFMARFFAFVQIRGIARNGCKCEKTKGDEKLSQTGTPVPISVNNFQVNSEVDFRDPVGLSSQVFHT